MKARSKTGTFLKWGALGVLIASLAVVPFAIFVGCDHNPVAPDGAWIDPGSEIAMHPGNRNKDSGGGNDYSGGNDQGVLVTVQSGGIVPLNWGSPANKLTVDPGCVESDVVIEVSVTPVPGNGNNKNKSVEIDFRPDGLVFVCPAKLVMDTYSLNLEEGGDADRDQYKLFWYDKDNRTWILQEVSKATKGKVYFDINHFSMYGISHLSAW